MVGFEYTYQYKDHLGNIRLAYQDMNGDGVISAETEIKEENHYYPFGLKHKGYNSAIVGRDHQYGYNGKEEQNELGLNLNDYHARLYDSSLGRMIQIDPSANKYSPVSPYNYTINNPVNFIDPDGKDFRAIVKRDDDGNYNITIQTTVHIYGDNSDKDTAEFAKKLFDKMGLKKNFGKDGKNTLNFDVTFKYHESKEEAIEATKKNPGDNLIEISDVLKRSELNFYKAGKKKENKGDADIINNGGFAILGGKEGKAKNAPASLHELGHLFGLGDRYKVAKNMGNLPYTPKKYLGDIMSNTYPTTISDVHYENLGSFIMTYTGNLEKGDTRIIPYTDFGGIPENDRK